jgi:hypothetical protein
MGRCKFQQTPLAAWKMVTKLKLKGSPGIINLRLQNEVLLMKNLHKFFNMHDLSWLNLIWTKYYPNGNVPGHTMKGSFWWKSILKLLNVYKGISQAEVGQEKLFFFEKICGMVVFFRSNTLNYSPSAPTEMQLFQQ